MNPDYNKDKWGPLDLKHLILDTEEFIVFIDNNNDLDWITTEEFDAKGPQSPEKHHETLNMVALLECKPIVQLSENDIVNFKRLLGEALARSLKHDYKKASSILVHAENFLIDRGKELSRKWYLNRAGLTSLSIFVIGAILWIFRTISIKILGESVFIVSLSMVSGAIGALLSIIFRMGNESIDCLAGKELHELESMYRIIAGMLSAFLASLLIRSEIFLPVFSKMRHLDLSIIAIGFIAGMSERFAPSILAKLEKNKKIV
jgi:hypothetical protein